MPFARPTLPQLIARFKADVRAYTEGGDALLRRSVETVLSKTVPGLTHGLHGHIAWAARQIFPDKSEPAFVQRWATMLGITPRPAAPAIGEADFATDGTLIPIGHLVQRNDGVRYEVTDAVVSGVGLGQVVTVQLEAEVPGADGNCDFATPLALVSPVAGVDSEGEVTDPDGLHDGVDAEDIEGTRVRVLERLKNPPRGGARGDYIRWALEVPGVTRVWETPRVQGAGTVGVQFTTDGEADPIPSALKVDQVQDYLAERAPITIGRSIGGDWVGVIVTAPTAHTINPEIQLPAGTAADVQTAIEAELKDFLIREAEPGKRIPLSRFDEAISIAEGEIEHVLISPAADIEPATGALPVLGAITWS